VEINVLGLRDLKPSMSFLPINKAFVTFDLASMQSESIRLRNVQTEPMDPGPNPTINALVQFNCKMPVDPLFAPSLQCSVFDYLFLGLSKPLIGTFTIPLGELFHKGNTHAGDGPDLGGLAAKQVSMEVDPLYEKIRILPKHASALGVTSVPGVTMTADLTVAQARLGQFVRLPEYAVNATTGKQEEINVPDANYYMQIGYDRAPGEKTMHYRYVIKGEYEKSAYIEASPFQTVNITKGQAIGSDSYFDLFRVQEVKPVGYFKGLIRIYRADMKAEREQRLQKLIERKEAMSKKTGDKATIMKGILAHVGGRKEEVEEDEDLQFDELSRMIRSKSKVICRLFILDAFGVAQKDENSLSDPYLVIKLGDTTISEAKNYQKDTSEPKFFKLYELTTTLPGASIIKIQCWDHDDILQDEKIGQTFIDLEDRFYSPRWRKIPEPPVETRPLFQKTSKIPQGAVRLWLEIMTAPERGSRRDWDITPRPPAEFEARLIVWETADVENMDVEGTSDLYVRAWVNQSEPKETDTHYRCQTGKGAFNWRFVFPIQLPCESCVANLQIWDRDMLSFNDFIADTNFAFTALANKAWETNARLKRVTTDEPWLRSKKEEEKFWVQCMRKKKGGGLEPGGKVQVSFELVPKEMSKACPVGEGRSAPNTDPFLPEPKGRFEWSWNPCKLIEQTVGPGVRCKLCCLFLCIICCLICIFVLPLVATSLISTAISDSTYSSSN